MASIRLAKAALHPLTNAAASAFLLWAASLLPFFPAVVLVIFLAVTYIVIGPRVQRSKAVWKFLFTPPVKVVAEGDRSRWAPPVLILSHQLSRRSDGSRLLHMLSVNCSYTDNAVFCVPPSRAFHMPLSRLTLYFLGGIVPYSRNVVLNLLQRRKTAPLVVSCIDNPTRLVTGEMVVTLKSKGVFSAVLKSGATLVPCVTIDDQVFFGAPIINGPTPTPSPDAVVELATRYAAALETLYEKHKGQGAPRLVARA